MTMEHTAGQGPLISLIVPVYRVEAYLDKCIRSLVEQTYTNLEILLVDDGSPDASGAICDRWAQKDPRIRVIHKENGGAGQARNVALDQARGQWIGLVDSDDFLEKHMYAHLLSLTGDTVDIAECCVVWTESEDCPLDDGTDAQVEVVDVQQAMRLHIRDEQFCQTPPNKLYRASVIGGIRFPEGNLIDDEFWTYRVIGNARRLAHSSAVMYAYRQQPGSAMHKPFSRRRLQGLYAKQQRLEYLRQRMPALVEEAKFDLLFTCLYGMQGCLKGLSGQELDKARQEIRQIAGSLGPVAPNADASRLKNLLARMAQHSMEGTARLLNLLIDLHILT